MPQGDTPDIKFKCDCCGCCCRSLKKVPALSEFDRGDGVCIHLRDDNLCSIYDCRPEICNVERMYEKFFASIYSREEFFRLNEEECERLKNNFR